MRFSIFLLSSCLLSYSSAFAPLVATTSSHNSVLSSPSALHMSSTESVSYVITGNNIEVTDALNEYVESKLDKIVGKISTSSISECDVHLTVNKNPKVKEGHKAEVVTFLKGTVIRCAEETADMYASIDAVTDRLAQKLRKYKERRLQGYHGGPNMGDNLAQVLEELGQEELEEEAAAPTDEEFVDPEAPVVTKIKSYDLSTPVSIEEAIFALDYVDHDFYVFREKESNEISVVYKRNVGGYGLINPK
eukprot:CAMPEP_0203638982 /NCGR_PEP_ID=MMETSP0088-20131115/4840_1 /ASSEMBLY_ACC=CAM_ASM_001087 /TAXON_ID=426623 /ORGANISM="Chaetoceros affinis, Strain CCMP159" /LENGTH=247 /DNA_ID=CAMNT_0050493735 /DNA_START=70 /DNA_END=813 /DNA_ORIENTATION=+